MIGISTLVWRREEVFEMWANNVIKTFGNIPVSVSYSEPHYRAIIEGFGFIAVESPNNLLGRKANASIQALRGLCDYVITTGSDDLFSANMPEIYEANKNYDYFGFLDCYFYNAKLDKSLYWPGYTCQRKGEPIGAGKMVSAKLLDQMNWQPFRNDISKSLDYFYTMKVKMLTNSYKFVNLVDYNAYLVDVKTDQNITKWEVLQNVTRKVHNEWRVMTKI